MRLLLLLAALLPAFAGATGPRLHFVDAEGQGVPVEVRARPSAEAAKLGELDPGGPGVAVLEPDESGAWGHVGWQGGSGWVELRHLRPAFAEGPELLRVTGVAEGDVLNVRAGPTVRSPVVGDLGGNGARVEVLEAGPEAKWGRILHGEGDGWVALRYLAPAEPVRVAPSPIPIGLLCTGTEPFWSLRVEGPDSLTFSEPGTGAGPEDDRATIGWAGSASGRRGFPAALEAEGQAGYTFLLRPAPCSDGMSDRRYGWAAELVTGQRLLTGCCRMDLEEKRDGNR